MGENAGFENGDIIQGQNDNGTDNAGDTDSQGHPAWQEILDILPDEALRTIVKPHLERWDSGVQSRFQNLQQQYEPWKPYIENDVDPEFVNQALGIAAAIENEPAKILAAMQEAYPDIMAEFLQQAAGSQGVRDTGGQVDDEDDDPYEARFAQHEQMMEKLAETFLADVEANESKENQEALDDYLGALKDTYGHYDETFVLTQIANGVDGEDAVKAFQSMVKSYGGDVTRTQQTANGAPTVLSSNGGLPTIRTDPSKLGSADTQELVKEMLRAAANADNA